MTNLNIDEKVTEMRALEAQVNMYKEQIEALKDLLKAEFDSRKVDIIHTDNYNLSYVPVCKNTFDSTKLKKDDPEMYAKYAKESSYLRFAVTAR